MDGVTGKYSVYDFFNMVIGGTLLLFGLIVSFHPYSVPVLEKLSEIIVKSIISSTVTIILLVILGYTTGIVVYTLCSATCGLFCRCFPKFHRFEENMMEICLSDEWIVGNPVKLNIYREKAKRYFEQEDIPVRKRFTRAQNRCFFAHCQYYIQCRGQNQKPELMRDVIGLSFLLASVLILLSTCNILALLGNPSTDRTLHIGMSAICLLGSAAFIHKYRRDVRNRIRMIIAIYDICVEKEINEKGDKAMR